MQLVIPWRRGQAKPWPSIPRINWAHPLTRGLTFYHYDLGGGYCVDLVSGQRGILTQQGSPATLARVAASKYGSGFQYPNEGNQTTANNIVYPTNSRFLANVFATPPCSSAIGMQQITTNGGVAGGIWAVLKDGQSDQYFEWLDDGVSNPFYLANNGTALGFTTSRAVNNHKFTTFVGALTSSTSLTTFYFDDLGYFQTTTQAVTGGDTGLGNPMQVVVGGDNGAGNYNGFVYYYAIWLGRALSQVEATWLANEPWSMLIFPEDEIAAQMVGATAAGFTWSQTSDDQLFPPEGHWLREMIRHD